MQDTQRVCTILNLSSCKILYCVVIFQLDFSLSATFDLFSQFQISIMCRKGLKLSQVCVSITKFFLHEKRKLLFLYIGKTIWRFYLFLYNMKNRFHILIVDFFSGMRKTALYTLYIIVCQGAIHSLNKINYLFCFFQFFD